MPSDIKNNLVFSPVTGLYTYPNRSQMPLMIIKNKQIPITLLEGDEQTHGLPWYSMRRFHFIDCWIPTTENTRGTKKGHYVLISRKDAKKAFQQLNTSWWNGLFFIPNRVSDLFEKHLIDFESRFTKETIQKKMDGWKIKTAVDLHNAIQPTGDRPNIEISREGINTIMDKIHNSLLKFKKNKKLTIQIVNKVVYNQDPLGSLEERNAKRYLSVEGKMEGDQFKITTLELSWEGESTQEKKRGKYEDYQWTREYTHENTQLYPGLFIQRGDESQRGAPREYHNSALDLITGQWRSW